MVRIPLLLLVMSAAFLTALPVQANVVPPICEPNPYIEVVGDGAPDATILFNPGLSTECGPWNSDLWTLDHAAEAAWLHYRVEHQYRIGQTTTWYGEIIAEYNLSPATLAANDTGAATYALNHSIVTHPGQMESNDHRYRLVVEIGGLYSNAVAAPYSVTGDFSGAFESAWVDYTVIRIVSGRFTERPGGFSLLQPTNPAPSRGLVSP